MKILKESNIVANIYDKNENIIETRHFSSRKQLDDYVNTLDNLVDMASDKELYKNIKANIDIQDIWKIIIDTSINEEKKKKPFIKRDAGNVEQSINTFNSMMTTGNSQGLGEALIPDSDIIELSTFKKYMKEYGLGKEDLKELKEELKGRAPEADLGG